MTQHLGFYDVKFDAYYCLAVSCVRVSAEYAGLPSAVWVGG